MKKIFHKNFFCTFTSYGRFLEVEFYAEYLFFIPLPLLLTGPPSLATRLSSVLD